MNKLFNLSFIACIAFALSVLSCGDNKDNEPELPIEPELPKDTIIPEEPIDTVVPTIDEYGICIDKEVNLGLSVKWAGWNVGASSPNGYGGYYAWGEIEEKKYFTWGNYMYYDSQTGGCIDIGTDISGTEYDVVAQTWGDNWRIPTHDEFGELKLKCSWTWLQYKGVNGYKVTGLNGNSIFLPAAGYYGVGWGSALSLDGRYGYYWSASTRVGTSSNAWRFNFGEGYCENNSSYSRAGGFTIRPVKNKM